MVYKRELKKKPPKGGEEQRQSEAVKRMSPEEKRKYFGRKRLERMFEDRRLVPAKPKEIKKGPYQQKKVEGSLRKKAEGSLRKKVAELGNANYPLLKENDGRTT